MKKPSLTTLRPPAELLYADELATLAKADKDPRPAGWKLSAKAVKAFMTAIQLKSASTQAHRSQP